MTTWQFNLFFLQQVIKDSITLRDVVDVSYAAPQAHGIVNVALHRDYSLGIIFIFSEWRKNLYHV
jgi:hypothetical protein